MWFLIRASFWLGLVYSQMDWSGGALATRDATPNPSAKSGSSSLGLASLCASEPRACLWAAQKAARFLPTIANGSTATVAAPARVGPGNAGHPAASLAISRGHA